MSFVVEKLNVHRNQLFSLNSTSYLDVNVSFLDNCVNYNDFLFYFCELFRLVSLISRNYASEKWMNVSLTAKQLFYINTKHNFQPISPKITEHFFLDSIMS